MNSYADAMGRVFETDAELSRHRVVVSGARSAWK